MKRPVLVAFALASALALLGACALPTESVEKAPTAPRDAAFRPVATVLVDRCGSLDCHGSKYRNMRLYGFGAQRLDPGGSPDGTEMTDAEVLQNYDSVTALEPRKLTDVVNEKGANPERLTFYRKARGLEDHKGGARVAPGDQADTCIRSWLAGAVDEPTCRAAVPRLAVP